MKSNPVRLALVYGSVRQGRFCDRVMEWLSRELASSSLFEVSTIDPARLHNAAEIKTHIGHAEAFIIVTPEYNHSYTAALKALIDTATSEWHAKPVAFVSYGGVSGGLRAVEHLRAVFAELHAVTIRDSVSFMNAWEQFDAAGELGSQDRSSRSLTTLLGRLHWWASALRGARAAVPYTRAA